MTSAHADNLASYLGAFVDELVAAGLEHVCLCPGSRSTPLALMFARHPKIRVWTHLDERSCSYFALGMAKASRKPVAILCSSGTAAVNFAPAVVEASQSHEPLLVLTADRPQELRDLGANQTIDQVRLYGPAAKWFVEMPLPESSEAMLRYVRMVARRAIETASGATPGPVHLNFPFREPLVPSPYEFALQAEPEDIEADEFDDDEDEDETIEVPADVFAATYLKHKALRDELASAQRGVIVCGPGTDASPELIGEVASLLGMPVLADPLSNLRTEVTGEGSILGAYDAFLRVPSVVDALRPDLVLRIGAPPTSKPLATYLQRYKDVRQIVLAKPGTWPDPDVTAQVIVEANAADVFAGLEDNVEDIYRGREWIAAWKHYEARALETTLKVIAGNDGLSEPGVVVGLAATVPEGAAVFCGNSMPVRDIDSFWPVLEKSTAFYANRGASGIDGVVSTALGVSALSEGHTVLVIGDLSFYHDMNGLLAAKRHNLKATIVLVNNDGGGIFSFLPQNSDQEHFEMLFGTPHGLDFEPVAALYGLGWTRVTSLDEYRQALRDSFAADGVTVIEVKTDRVENLKLHQRIWEEVAKAVAPVAIEAAP